MDKIKVYSYFDRPDIIPNNPGNVMEPVFELKVNDKGEQELVKVGETNNREKIQQYKDECDIGQILARAAIDPTVLNQREVFYADVTEMPKSLAEAQSMIISIKKEFDKMPPEERAKFDYSVEKYIAEFGTKEWAEKVGATQEETKIIKEVEKATEPQKEEKGGNVNES